MRKIYDYELMISKAKMDIRSLLQAHQYKMAYELFVNTASKLDGRLLKEFVTFFAQ